MSNVRAHSVIIGQREANAFIQGYTLLMKQIHGSTSGQPKLLEVLSSARAKYIQDRSLLNSATAALQDKNEITPEVIAAVRGLEVKNWVYLKDTKTYSVFIDPSGADAYAVLGLTQRIRDVVGASGAVVEIGVMPYAGRYVTDGIITRVAWLGSNYKKNFTELLASLKSNKRFHLAYEP